MKRDAETVQFTSTNNNSNKNHIFKMAERLKRDNVGVVGEKCVRNDDGNFDCQ